jgi:hypothetical protein
MPPRPLLCTEIDNPGPHQCRDVGKGCITAELIDPDELVAGIITRETDGLSLQTCQAWRSLRLKCPDACSRVLSYMFNIEH